MAADETSKLTRKVANLTPKAMRALADLVDQEFGIQDTEAINRALILAAYLMVEVKAGAKIQIVREGEPPVNVIFL